MRTLAKFIMEGKIPPEILVFLASLFLAFNTQIYTFVLGTEDFITSLVLLVNFVVFLLASVPLAIGILRFSYARSLLFVIALVLPLLIVSKFFILYFFAGLIIFAYLLRILRNLGLSILLSSLILMPLFGQIQWLSGQEKQAIAQGVLNMRSQAQSKLDVQKPTQAENSNQSAQKTQIAPKTNEQKLAEDLSQNFQTKQADKSAKTLTPEEVLAFGNLLDASFTASLLILSIGLVFFARWLQSLLYYPGGFKAEFLQLRINFWFAIVSLILVVVLSNLLNTGLKYVVMLLIPYFFVGIALLHYIFALKKISKPMVIGFYIVLLIFPQVLVLFITLIGIIDAMADFRKRIEA